MKLRDIFIIISNSGRNAMPIEIAMLAKEKGLKVIAITSIEQSKKYPSRHSSRKKLYDLADIVIDNCVPSGDGMLNIIEMVPLATMLSEFIFCN